MISPEMMKLNGAVMAPTSLAQLPNGRNRKQPKTPPSTCGYAIASTGIIVHAI
jgi:hypothetical protein